MVSTDVARVAAVKPAVTTPTRSHRRRPVWKSLLLHLALLLATTVSLAPVVWILLSSFKPAYAIRSTRIRLTEEPTLNNYLQVLTQTDLPRWMLNSVLVAVFTMLIGVFMAATAGYALSRFRFPGKRSLMWTFLVTQMFPVAILIVPIYTIMSSLGLINSLVSLVIAYCTVAVPFCAWMLVGYFDTIPVELDEAAALDGLNPFATFWRVVLPLAKPGLVVTAFFTFLTAWGEVAYATAFLQTSDRYTLGIGLQTFVPQFNQRWELLTPAAILIMVPACVVFFFAQRHLVSGLTAGATKG